MKPNFKTTALAILVSLGAVACSSNSSHDGAQPVKVTKPAEATKPAETTTSAETTTPAEPTNPFEPTKPAEATKPVEAAKFDFKKEATLANGKEWRYYDFSNATVGPDKDGISRDYVLGVEGGGVLNFNKLSKYSTGEFIGVANDEPYVLNKKVAKNGVHYHFINQPYSTYGFISDGEGLSERAIDSVGNTFYVIQHSYGAENPVDGVYSGNVIAEITNSDFKYIVKNDGKVTLNVKTNSDANDKLMLSGSVNSNTVGEIKLLPTEVKSGNAYGLVALQGVAGKYDAIFSDNHKDVVGSVFINDINDKTNLKVNIEGKDSPIIMYKAAFGGQRQ